jgi:hypothetical protein
MRIGSAAAAKTVDRLLDPAGLSAGLAALSSETASTFQAAQIRTLNVAQDLAERAEPVQYPGMHVYCEKVQNRQTEKFRSFSGAVHLAIEIRHSQDRLEAIEEVLNTYVDATTRVLTASRGDWGDGMFYGGEYEVSYGAVKRGGRNFIQTAKITFEIGVSRN